MFRHRPGKRTMKKPLEGLKAQIARSKKRTQKLEKKLAEALERKKHPKPRSTRKLSPIQKLNKQIRETKKILAPRHRPIGKTMYENLKKRQSRARVRLAKLEAKLVELKEKKMFSKK